MCLVDIFRAIRQAISRDKCRLQRRARWRRFDPSEWWSTEVQSPGWIPSTFRVFRWPRPQLSRFPDRGCRRTGFSECPTAALTSASGTPGCSREPMHRPMQDPLGRTPRSRRASGLRPQRSCTADRHDPESRRAALLREYSPARK